MDQSPAGHDIKVVFGNADGIKARGLEVESLGDQMIGAAGVLRAIADNGVPQKGLSIEKIKEVIGEIDEELRLAGERYRPSGTALVDYARALATVQDEMHLVVPRCQTAWDEYDSARSSFGSIEGAPPPVTDEPHTGPGLSPAEEHRNDVAAARSSMDGAYDEFLAEARLFDTHFETWEAAFDAATDGIRDATDGGIEDGFWDDVDGFVAGVLVVLQWAGVVLAVLALVIGGPIIAALGAIVAIASLAITIYQKSRGDTGWLELGLAIVGVIPFGKLASFSGGFKAGTLGMLDGMVGGLGTSAGRTAFTTAIRDFPDAFSAGAGGFRAFTNAMGGSSSLDDVGARLMGMGDNAEITDAMGRGGWGAAGVVAGHYGWVVNAPVAVGLTIYDWGSGLADGAQVETWEQQLAATP